MKFLPLPPQEELLLVLDYDPKTGVLNRKGHPEPKHKKLIKFGGQQFTKSRVIWKMMTGEEPKDTVDHHDGDRGNNRWGNLRDADNSQQQFNRGSTNKSGYRGVYQAKKNTWRIGIWAYGKAIHKYGFKTLADAVTERKRLEKLYHGEFSRDRR